MFQCASCCVGKRIKVESYATVASTPTNPKCWCAWVAQGSRHGGWPLVLALAGVETMLRM
jgi:hypothetical protein